MTSALTDKLITEDSDEDDVDYTPENDASSGDDQDVDVDEEFSDTEARVNDKKAKSEVRRGLSTLVGSNTSAETAHKQRIDAIWQEFGNSNSSSLLQSTHSTRIDGVTKDTIHSQELIKQIAPRNIPLTDDTHIDKRSRPRPVRRSPGLTLLAKRYGVPLAPERKLNTLDKSKLDWQQFVKQEGLVDDLAQHNKDGYLEKVAFLQRTDERQEQTLKSLRQKRRR